MRKNRDQPDNFFIPLTKPTKLFVCIFFGIVSVLFLASFMSLQTYFFAIIFYIASLLSLVQAAKRYRLLKAIGVHSGRWFVVTQNEKVWLTMLNSSVVLPGLLFLHFLEVSQKKLNVMVSKDMTRNAADFRALARNAKLNSLFSGD